MTKERDLTHDALLISACWATLLIHQKKQVEETRCQWYRSFELLNESLIADKKRTCKHE